VGSLCSFHMMCLVRTRLVGTEVKEVAPVKGRSFQRAVLWVVDIVIAVVLVGDVLQGLDALSAWITPSITYSGTAVIFLWCVFQRYVLPRWRIPWEIAPRVITDLHRMKLGRRLAVITIVLWLPRVGSWIAPPIHSPELNFSLHSGRENEYAPGYEVNGVKWKPEFSKHTFSIENKSKRVEIHDLRTSLVLPGPIYDYRIKNKVGINQVDVRRIGLVASEYTDKDWRVVAPRDTYSNAIFINVDKLGYESYLNVELRLDLNRKDVGDTMSIVDAKYLYSGNDGKKSLPKSEVYNVRKRDGSSMLYIDKANPLRVSPLSFDYEHSFRSVLGENTDVKDVEDKHFRVHVEYPFMIHTDRIGRFTIKYPPYVSDK
jgi:hypothetical protein